MQAMLPTTQTPVLSDWHTFSALMIPIIGIY